ncbi:MAG: indolepyruvate ferredoxin oxidoreductase subunit alpha [Eubacterium sp.]|nr:indolepyruvate ferredoxin oxidoreductase subunit alpha [Eubacterium sp.]
MKQLMLGNKAVARGLYEAGCGFISSYPGTPSTEITEEAAKYKEIYCEWAPNEKVALEAAFGASLGGRRAACAMKHVGLNVAADPLFSISYIGVNAGLVICVADDPGMHSSQNEQDSRHYAIAAKLPMLEPSGSAEARDFAIRAYEISEEYKTPVFLRMCTRISHSQGIVDTSAREERELLPYEKDQERVMMPAQAKRAHYKVEKRTLALTELAEKDPVNFIVPGEDKSIGIITSGTCYQYAREVFGQKYSILKLGMINPLPVEKIRTFAESVDRVIVIEELDPVIENHCKSLGIRVDGKNIFPMVDEFSQKIIADCMSLPAKETMAVEDPIPGRPPLMCSGCPHRGLFYTLKKHNCMVYGDIGCYTLGAVAPLNTMDLNVCMGASLSGMHGFNKARGAEAERHTVGVIGDSTFMHSGMTGLANIAYNRSNSVSIILDNSITGMTGHQQNPTTGYSLKGDPAGRIDLEALCLAMGFPRERVHVVDPYDLKACDQVIGEELACDEPSVIISRRPCALLKYVKHQPAFHVEEDKCVGCKSCMKIGCPSLSMKDGKSVIDPNQCVGCGVCQQMCKLDAILDSDNNPHASIRPGISRWEMEQQGKV